MTKLHVIYKLSSGLHIIHQFNCHCLIRLISSLARRSFITFRTSNLWLWSLPILHKIKLLSKSLYVPYNAHFLFRNPPKLFKTSSIYFETSSPYKFEWLTLFDFLDFIKYQTGLKVEKFTNKLPFSSKLLAPVLKSLSAFAGRSPLNSLLSKAHRTSDSEVKSIKHLLSPGLVASTRYQSFLHKMSLYPFPWCLLPAASGGNRFQTHLIPVIYWLATAHSHSFLTINLPNFFLQGWLDPYRHLGCGV